MQLIIIKAIFLLLMNVIVIFYSFSVNSVELIKAYPKQSLKTHSAQLQNFEIVNLVSDIKYDYLHNMARYAESKMTNINSRTLAIFYPVGKKISDSRPFDFWGSESTHEVVLTQPEINELVLRASAFFEGTSCDNKIVLSFDQKVQAGTGNIIINNLDGTTIATNAVDSSNVTFNDNTIVIDYGNTGIIEYMEKFLINDIDTINDWFKVNVLIPSGVIRDEANNAFGDVVTQATLTHHNNAKKIIVKNLKLWLEAGGGGANMIPFSVGCGKDNDRMIVVSVNTEGKINKSNLQYLFFHEAYHSFQQDLTMCEVSGDNDNWLIEGSADYFALYINAWAQGLSEDFVSRMLERVLMNATLNGIELENAGVKYHSGQQGQGVLRLMVERGWLEESRILDGSIFYNCASVKEFRNSDPKIQFVKKNWHQIEEKNGIFQFKESVLKESLD